MVISTRQEKRGVIAFICEFIVFIAYGAVGYFSWKKSWAMLMKCHEEGRRLSPTLLSATCFGIPIGALKCSIDRGWLPVDDIFPGEMNDIRSESKRIAYFGKFAVIPFLQRKHAGRALMKAAVDWSEQRDIDTAVVLVVDKHVPIYRKIGFRTVCRADQAMNGLDRAVPVLMCVMKDDLKKICSIAVDPVSSGTPEFGMT